MAANSAGTFPTGNLAIAVLIEFAANNRDTVRSVACHKDSCPLFMARLQVISKFVGEVAAAARNGPAAHLLVFGRFSIAKIQILDRLVLPYGQIHRRYRLAWVLFDGNEVAPTQDEVNSSIRFAVRETRFQYTT